MQPEAKEQKGNCNENHRSKEQDAGADGSAAGRVGGFCARDASVSFGQRDWRHKGVCAAGAERGRPSADSRG